MVGNPTIKETKPGSDSKPSSATKLQGHFSGIIVDN